MTAVIARRGKFTLRYASRPEPTTWDLEICADCPHHEGVYSLCRFCPDNEEEPDIKSCGLRLLRAMETREDMEDIKVLCLIASDLIRNTEQVPLIIYSK